jgi:hypothetical protein
VNKNESLISEITLKHVRENKDLTITERHLLTEIVTQLKEMNSKLDSIHDEIWDANQRRSDEL